jgi:hypothetical protein
LLGRTILSDPHPLEFINKKKFDILFESLFSEPFAIKLEITTFLVNFTNIPPSDDFGPVVNTLNAFGFFSKLKTLFKEGTWLPPAFTGQLLAILNNLAVLSVTDVKDILIKLDLFPVILDLLQFGEYWKKEISKQRKNSGTDILQLDKRDWLLENRPFIYNTAHQTLELVRFCLYEDDQKEGKLKDFLINKTLLLDHILSILSDEKLIGNNTETIEETSYSSLKESALLLLNNLVFSSLELNKRMLNKNLLSILCANLHDSLPTELRLCVGRLVGTMLNTEDGVAKLEEKVLVEIG